MYQRFVQLPTKNPPVHFSYLTSAVTSLIHFEAFTGECYSCTCIFHTALFICGTLHLIRSAQCLFFFKSFFFRAMCPPRPQSVFIISWLIFNRCQLLWASACTYDERLCSLCLKMDVSKKTRSFQSTSILWHEFTLKKKTHSPVFQSFDLWADLRSTLILCLFLILLGCLLRKLGVFFSENSKWPKCFIWHLDGCKLHRSTDQTSRTFMRS